MQHTDDSYQFDSYFIAPTQTTPMAEDSAPGTLGQLVHGGIGANT